MSELKNSIYVSLLIARWWQYKISAYIYIYISPSDRCFRSFQPYGLKLGIGESTTTGVVRSPHKWTLFWSIFKFKGKRIHGSLALKQNWLLQVYNWNPKESTQTLLPHQSSITLASSLLVQFQLVRIYQKQWSFIYPGIINEFQW